MLEEPHIGASVRQYPGHIGLLVGLDTAMVVGRGESPLDEVDMTRQAFAANMFHLPQSAFEQPHVTPIYMRPQSLPQNRPARFADLPLERRPSPLRG